MVDERIQQLSSLLEFTSSQARLSLLTFKCRFLQLAAVAARDRLDLPQSLEQSEEALALATYIDNAELQAASLFRRARTHLYMQNYDLAVQDLERALPYAHRSRNPLKSYVFICLAEAYSLCAPNDSQVKKAAFALLDAVGKALRDSKNGHMDGDGSYTRIDVSGWAIEQANVFGRFGQLALARESVHEAHNELIPTWTR